MRIQMELGLPIDVLIELTDRADKKSKNDKVSAAYIQGAIDALLDPKLYEKAGLIKLEKK